MKRSLRLASISIVLALFLNLTGCSKFDKKLINGSPLKKETDSNEKKKTITLKLWNIWATDSDSNKKPFEKVLKDWNLANPDVQIEADATENETYKTKIRTAMAVNEPPDIFYSWGAGFARPFVEADKVLQLDGYLDDGTKEKLLPGTLENFTYDGKIYGLPIYMTAVVFYYNKDIFDKSNIKMPETFDELIEAVEELRKSGITPIVAGVKDRWPGMFFQNILAVRTAGMKLSKQALNKEASFTQPEFIESAEKLSELVKAGAFDRRSLRLTAYEAEEEFKNGRAAMYYNGSWAVSSLVNEKSPVRGKVIAKNFPLINKSISDTDGFLGGAIDTFMISSRTQYKDEAVRALKTIDENFSRESYISGASQPAWKNNVDEAALNPLAVSISRLLNESTGFVLAWDTFLEGEDSETHKDLVTEIFAGSKTPEEFAEGMQRLNERDGRK